jgi:hypothetical protein
MAEAEPLELEGELAQAETEADQGSESTLTLARANDAAGPDPPAAGRLPAPSSPARRCR